MPDILSQRVLTRIQKFDYLPNYQPFLEDVTALTHISSNQSLPGITAETWLEQLDTISDGLLTAYIAKYSKGRLNPRKDLPPWQQF